MRTQTNFDIAAVLVELFFGDESSELLEATLERLVSKDFVQRINGQVYERGAYLAHVREMRQMVTGSGDLRVLEEVRQGPMIAGRYIFSLGTAAGLVQFESHLFAEIDGEDKILRLVEVARQTSDEDSLELVPGAPASP